jgi:hypothetical protein
LRLASRRVQRAMDAIGLVAQLAAPQNDYSDEEAAHIVTALRGSVNEVETRLARKKAKPQFSFE